MIPPGIYLVDTLDISNINNITLKGSSRGVAGAGASVIKSRSGSTIMEGSTGLVRGWHIEDVTFEGNGGAGHGIHLQSGLSSNPYGWYLNRVKIQNTGGKGFYDEKGMFETNFHQLFTDDCGSDHVDIVGGPAILFLNCRIWGLNTGTIGYRIRKQSADFVSCNSVNTAGSGTGVEVIRMGETARARAGVYGCNFEDVQGICISLRNGSTVELGGSTGFRPLTTTDMVAIRQEGGDANDRCVIGESTVFASFPANYLNSQAIHAATTAFQGVTRNRQVTTFYAESAAASRDLEGSYMELRQVSVGPAAPASTAGRLFLEQSGGALQLVTRFNTGSSRVIATELTTKANGTATLVSGTTSIAVTHGLGVTPAIHDISVTPIEAWGSMTQFWITTPTATQFTINANVNPAQDVDFAWTARVQ